MSAEVQAYIDLAMAKANQYAKERAAPGSQEYTMLYNCYISAFSWWHGEVEHLKAVIKAHGMNTDEVIVTATPTPSTSVEDMI